MRVIEIMHGCRCPTHGRDHEHVHVVAVVATIPVGGETKRDRHWYCCFPDAGGRLLNCPPGCFPDPVDFEQPGMCPDIWELIDTGHVAGAQLALF